MANPHFVPNNCDKCKTPVPCNNSVAMLEFLMTSNLKAGFAGQRHFLPVIVDGKPICDGSPSRAQYIKGQPRDTRGYGYDKSREAEIREAFVLLTGTTTSN